MLGLIGRKIAMTQVFNDDGVVTPVTIVKIEENFVIAQKTVDKNGYAAVVLGAFDKKEKRTNKACMGQFKEGLNPKKKLIELRDFEKECSVGDALGLELFENIRFVDIEGTTKGKGFQGVMKRHGFGGGRATHGSKFHRAAGSTGMAAWPSRVFKGTKMAGRMGGENFTAQNLEIVKVDPENKLLLIKGAVPGTKKSIVVVKRAKKK